MLWGGNMNNVIILNKMFEGSWNNTEGHISHEIIDFVLTDEGQQYIYNTPGGHCPKEIYVGEKPTNKKETHKAKYLLLTSTTHKDKVKGTYNFYINYFIELEEKLHNFSTTEDIEKAKDTREEITKLCNDREIKYNGKYLYQIYNNDNSLLVTFKAKSIMKAKKPVEVALTYNFQRNKGYVKSDKFPNDYQEIKNRIEESENWEKFELKRIDDLNCDKSNDFARKTFLDLILKTDSEECYTNILFSVLSQGDLINKFCKKFKKDNEILNEEKSFDVSREFGIVGGRMDICADNGNQKIVIENKVFSGLNGVRKDEKTQLSTYFKWAEKDTKQEPLCFITVPDYREDELKQEILEKDNGMKDIYNIVCYSEIRRFIEDHLEELNDNYDYDKYSMDFPAIFNQHSHKTKQEYYTNLFLRAILNSNDTKEEKQT